MSIAKWLNDGRGITSAIFYCWVLQSSSVRLVNRSYIGTGYSRTSGFIDSKNSSKIAERGAINVQKKMGPNCHSFKTDEKSLSVEVGQGIDWEEDRFLDLSLCLLTGLKESVYIT